MNDAEAKTYSRDLGAVLQSAGWAIAGERDAIFQGDPIGLQVTVSRSLAVGDSSGSTLQVPQERIPRAAVVLLEALKKIGLDPIPAVHNDGPEIVGIVVGHKP